MATSSRAFGALRLLENSAHRTIACIPHFRSLISPINRRSLLQSTKPSPPTSSIPDFAFAFDIDGVLLRSHDPIPRAREALSLLQSECIPFILLTNGGGKPESERVAELEDKLKIPLDISMFIQSHTPFADLEEYKGKTILVLGGDEDRCRFVAEQYGFKSVVVPGDIFVQHSEIWPFSEHLLNHYKAFARPLPRPINAASPQDSLRIDAIFVYNDPRDWGLDATLVLDLLLSQKGILGTTSAMNGKTNLPNKGYQQDGQPKLYFSNPDLWWAAKYHLPRLGQGGFREALEGLWRAVTGGKGDVALGKEIIGKPYYKTYEYAEKRLISHRNYLFKGRDEMENVPLKRVYMVGDNPESDIRGGNSFKSPLRTDWNSILVRTGVHREGEPAWKPKVIVDDVHDAVQWALQQSKWPK
ncbi:cat eye syndrome critical region protein 5 precursor [Tothia fuscella]|uniref:Cat eye syndrome critical region protein 5 n=1 Tax=Tothia fuscella TaxID=1048955 RepID=A0A9P4NXP8_9PEZI|nr:cat eye syndrome critical region protein 5 precursor [Tothia fuscella]